MATSAVSEFKLGLALKAYGFDIKLWKERGEREWAASLRDDNDIVKCHFEEDNLTLAKLHVLGEARNRVKRSDTTDLPGCDTFLDSWKPVRIINR